MKGDDWHWMIVGLIEFDPLFCVAWIRSEEWQSETRNWLKVFLVVLRGKNLLCLGPFTRYGANSSKCWVSILLSQVCEFDSCHISLHNKHTTRSMTFTKGNAMHSNWNCVSIYSKMVSFEKKTSVWIAK